MQPIMMASEIAEKINEIIIKITTNCNMATTAIFSGDKWKIIKLDIKYDNAFGNTL